MHHTIVSYQLSQVTLTTISTPYTSQSGQYPPKSQAIGPLDLRSHIQPISRLPGGLQGSKSAPNPLESTPNPWKSSQIHSKPPKTIDLGALGGILGIPRAGHGSWAPGGPGPPGGARKCAHFRRYLIILQFGTPGPPATFRAGG